MSTGVPMVETTENQRNVRVAVGELHVDDRHERGDRARRGGEHCGVGAGSQSLDEVGGCQVEHAADGLAAGPLEERRRHLGPVLDGARTGPGSSISRRTLAGSGTGSGAHRPANRRAAPALTRTTSQRRFITTAGYGACWSRTRSSAAMTRSIAGSSRSSFGVDRGEPGGDQQTVAVAQRDVEGGGDAKHHLAAGLGPPRLHEAHVPGSR